MRMMNLVVVIILCILMMLLETVAAAHLINFAIFYGIFSNTEISNLVDCNERCRTFQSLWWRGATSSRLNLLKVQFSSSRGSS
jgi:hypothetical protein